MAWKRVPALTVDEMRQRVVVNGPEVAATCGVSEFSVRRWVREGILPTVKVGNRHFYPAEAVLRLMGVDPAGPITDRTAGHTAAGTAPTAHPTATPCPCGCGYMLVSNR